MTLTEQQITDNYKELRKIINDTFSDLRLDKLNLNCEGSLIVGGGGPESGDSAPFGFSGLLSKFTIFNYDLNKNDMYKEYHNGPINGILASLGIGAYGLRNPVYKLKAANVELREG